MPVGPGTRVGPYDVVSLLGAGGMGEVYRARDSRLGRDVAIKVLPGEFAADPDRLGRFEQEARAVAALDHPNILAIHDVGTHEGAPYIVTELLEGESLRERLAGGALPVRKAVEVAVQIAQGLSAAHEKGIVHRDLKPGNVFITKDGRVKILDFGIAKLARAEGSSDPYAPTSGGAPSTDSGAVLGTMGYISPEQLRGRPADPRSDIFSLGCLMYEMLAGRSPFLRGTGAETVSAILSEDPRPLSGSGREVPPALQEIVHRCLEKTPEERFSSAHDLSLALRAFSGTGETPETVPTPVARRERRSAWLPWSGALVAVGVVVAFLAWSNVGGLRTRLFGSGTAPPRVIKLAVLPLANLSGDPEQEYLSDGLTQEMITELGRLHPETLSVIARTSVMRYKKTDKGVDQIARELGVEYVLEGSARREGSKVRVSAELIRAADQAQLWADSFERDLAGVLALESEVARKVAGALALKLLPAERSRIARPRTVIPDAYEAYLKGMHHWYKLTAGDLVSSQRYFELALAKDPEYALAYAGMACVWLGRAQMGFVSPAEAGPKGKAAAAKAIELDDTAAETHFVLAGIRAWVDWDWTGAEAEFKRAIELNPSYPDARSYYAHLLMAVGRSDEAMTQARRALELDPFNALFQGMYGVDLMYLRRWDEAIARARTVLSTSPDDLFGQTLLWYASSGKGDREAVMPAARASMRLSYNDPEVDAALAPDIADGNEAGAMRRAADALARRFRTGYANPTDIAILYVGAGDRERALTWLEKGLEVRDQNMPYLGMGTFEAIRSEPRFQALLRRMNLPAK